MLIGTIAVAVETGQGGGKRWKKILNSKFFIETPRSRSFCVMSWLSWPGRPDGWLAS